MSRPEPRRKPLMTGRYASTERYAADFHGRATPAPGYTCYADRRFTSRRPAPAARHHAACAPIPKVVAVGRNCGRAGAGGYFLVPLVDTALNTVSTDDAYVNGHMTFVAPRVSGQVMKVLVDDNQGVKKGDLLVQLDKEPYEVQVALKRAAVRVAEANLAAAESKARGLGAQLVAQRWKLQNASEQVDAQVALLRSQVAALRSAEATLVRAAPIMSATRAWQERGPSLVRRSTSINSSFGSRKPTSPSAGRGRPDSGGPRPRTPTGNGQEPHRHAAGPEPDLLRGPSGLGRMHADGDPARTAASTKRLFGCFVIRLGRDARATTGLAPAERMFGHYLAIPRASVPTRLARVERMFP